jgi:long-chain acyl-CoA synthetase
MTGEGDEIQKEIVQLVESQIDQFLAGGKFEDAFPHRWLPASFSILVEGFTEDNHLMNSTLKIVRPKIIERYKDRVESMYTPQGKIIFNDQNIQAVKKLFS